MKSRIRNQSLCSCLKLLGNPFLKHLSKQIETRCDLTEIPSISYPLAPNSACMQNFCGKSCVAAVFCKGVACRTNFGVFPVNFRTTIPYQLLGAFLEGILEKHGFFSEQFERNPGVRKFRTPEICVEVQHWTEVCFSALIFPFASSRGVGVMAVFRLGWSSNPWDVCDIPSFTC